MDKVKKLREDHIQWHFYDRAEEAWLSMKEACINARRTIDIEQYILDEEEIGGELLSLLIQKKEEGVHIRILCDMVGSYSFFSSNIPKTLRGYGIEVRFFNPIRPWRIGSRLSWYFRDHRKLMMVDGRVGFVGSVGFREDMRYWREAHVRVTGSITKEMSFAFEEMWETAGAGNFFRRLEKTRKFFRGFHFLTNSPFVGRRYIYEALIYAIRNAKKSISITTPYFIPDHRLNRALRLARRRNVSVRILIPHTSDVPLVDRASRWFFHRLLQKGVKIFLYKESILHAKTIAVDGNWASLGSFNLDSLSFSYNYEANLVSIDKGFVAKIESLFEEDLKQSEEVTLREWQARPWTNKVKEWLASRLRFIL
jgi:cardiolipin synthase